VWGRKHRNSF
jgi:hypothetical protein